MHTLANNEMENTYVMMSSTKPTRHTPTFSRGIGEGFSACYYTLHVDRVAFPWRIIKRSKTKHTHTDTHPEFPAPPNDRPGDGWTDVKSNIIHMTLWLIRNARFTCSNSSWRRRWPRRLVLGRIRMSDI